MTEPMTANVGLIVPNTGDLVDTWGEDALNPDYVAIDGMLGGVQGISVSNLPITLTSPAGFTPTPGAGPTQSQNRVLRFTGTLTADVTVTLPIPAVYVIEHLATGNFNLIFRGATATEVVAAPPGERVTIYNDGANVRFVDMGRLGVMEHWVGLSSMPAWVNACTIRPYLPCDGLFTYNYSEFPFLGARLGSTFGGNGITTFGTPDMRGRVPLAYDGTGTRITTAGCGLDGQDLGATLDAQTVTLAANQIPTITAVNAAQSISVTSTTTKIPNNVSGAGTVRGDYVTPNSPSVAYVPGSTTPWTIGSVTSNDNNSISTTYTNASQKAVNNVQPSIVTGIWVIKTG